MNVSLPAGISIQFAQKFVNDKRSWIKKTLIKLAEKKKNSIINLNQIFYTKKHEVSFEAWKQNTFSYKYGNGKGVVYYPEKLTDEEQINEGIQKGLEEIMRAEAKYLIPPLVEKYADSLELKYNKVTIKNMVTRWGSCSGKGNLNFSLHLMKVPDHLIKYVILHELTHLTVKNHSSEFWKLLDKYCGGKAKIFDKEMNKFTARW